MDYRKILDKNIDFSNYANFKRCDIGSDNKTITFVMANGVKYAVNIEYFLKWNEHPHHLFVDGQLIKWEEKVSNRIGDKNLLFSKCERILSNTAVRVYLSNGFVYEVPWDTVLMACEKKYEYFGGLTDTSKQIVSQRGREKK